jgi:hypothetical protein
MMNVHLDGHVKVVIWTSLNTYYKLNKKKVTKKTINESQ